MTDANAFAECLDPQKINEFGSRYWEKQPLVLNRNEPDRFNRLIDLNVFDNLVAYTNLRAPLFRLFNKGTEAPRHNCTVSRQVGTEVELDLADLNAIYDQYDQGSTIVLVALEKKYAPLAELCIGLEDVFGCPFQAYAYLTPPNSNGPPAHYDTHDVFVLQIAGRKHWRIWEPITELPLRLNENKYDHDGVTDFSNQNPAKINTPLAAGDTAYIPRGFIHSASTVDEASLHVSLSAMVIRNVDIVELAIQRTMHAMKKIELAQRSMAFGLQPWDRPSTLDCTDLSKLFSIAHEYLVSTLDTEDLDVLFNAQRTRWRAGRFQRRLINGSDKPIT